MDLLNGWSSTLQYRVPASRRAPAPEQPVPAPARGSAPPANTITVQVSPEVFQMASFQKTLHDLANSAPVTVSVTSSPQAAAPYPQMPVCYPTLVMAPGYATPVPALAVLGMVPWTPIASPAAAPQNPQVANPYAAPAPPQAPAPPAASAPPAPVSNENSENTSPCSKFHRIGCGLLVALTLAGGAIGIVGTHVGSTPPPPPTSCSTTIINNNFPQAPAPSQPVVTTPAPQQQAPVEKPAPSQHKPVRHHHPHHPAPSQPTPAPAPPVVVIPTPEPPAPEQPPVVTPDPEQSVPTPTVPDAPPPVVTPAPEPTVPETPAPSQGTPATDFRAQHPVTSAVNDYIRVNHLNPNFLLPEQKMPTGTAEQVQLGLQGAGVVTTAETTLETVTALHAAGQATALAGQAHALGAAAQQAAAAGNLARAAQLGAQARAAGAQATALGEKAQAAANIARPLSIASGAIAVVDGGIDIHKGVKDGRTINELQHIANFKADELQQNGQMTPEAEQDLQNANAQIKDMKHVSNVRKGTGGAKVAFGGMMIASPFTGPAAPIVGGVGAVGYLGTTIFQHVFHHHHQAPKPAPVVAQPPATESAPAAAESAPQAP